MWSINLLVNSGSAVFFRIFVSKREYRPSFQQTQPAVSSGVVEEELDRRSRFFFLFLAFQFESQYQLLKFTLGGFFRGFSLHFIGRFSWHLIEGSLLFFLASLALNLFP